MQSATVANGNSGPRSENSRNLNSEIKALSARDNWTNWCEANHTGMSLRSAQDYMSIAKIPNAIRYAWIGKERLLQVQRAVKGSKDEDPIGSYLRDHGVDFDPNVEDPKLTERIRIQIDTLIAMFLFKSIGEKEELELDVDRDLIRKLIAFGIKVEPGGIVRDVVIIARSGGDPNQYLNDRHLEKGPEWKLIRDTKKIQGIPKLVSSFRDTIDFLKKNPDLVSQINTEKLEDLERQAAELKTLMDNN